MAATTSLRPQARNSLPLAPPTNKMLIPVLPIAPAPPTLGQISESTKVNTSLGSTSRLDQID